MNNELTSLTLDEYVEDFQQNENPDSLTNVVQSGGFIRAPSVTPDMIDNQDKVLEEPGALLQNGGGCGACASGRIRNSEFAPVQSGGNTSLDTNALFQQFLDDNESMASLQSGGNVSVDTNALFQQFLEENKSLASVQSGGNTSLDTNALFQQFLDDNQSLASVQSGGNTSLDTNALFNNFLEDNVNEMISVQSGGDDSLYSSIASDLMSTGTIDLFSNFVNKHKFKKQMQTGGGDKQEDSNGDNKKIMNVKKAVSLLNEVYKN